MKMKCSNVTDDPQHATFGGNSSHVGTSIGHNHLYMHPFNSLFFQDNLGMPAPERLKPTGF